jgi:hypothetical protein
MRVTPQDVLAEAREVAERRLERGASAKPRSVLLYQ